MKNFIYSLIILIIFTILIFIISYFCESELGFLNTFIFMEFIFLLYYIPTYIYKSLYCNYLLSKKLSFLKNIILIIFIIIPLFFISIDIFSSEELFLNLTILYISIILPIIDLILDYRKSIKFFKKYFIFICILSLVFFSLFMFLGINVIYSFIYIFLLYLGLILLKDIFFIDYFQKIKRFYKYIIFIIVFLASIFFIIKIINIGAPSKIDFFMNKYRYDNIVNFINNDNKIELVTDGYIRFYSDSNLINFCHEKGNDVFKECNDSNKKLLKKLKSLGIEKIDKSEYIIGNTNGKFLNFTFDQNKNYIYSKGFFTDLNNNFYSNPNYNTWILNNDWGILIK